MPLELNAADQAAKTAPSGAQPGAHDEQHSAAFKTATAETEQRGRQRIPAGTDVRASLFGFSATSGVVTRKAMHRLERDTSPVRAVKEFAKSYAEMMNLGSYINIKIRFDHSDFPGKTTFTAPSSAGESLQDFLKTIDNKDFKDNQDLKKDI